MTSEQFYNTVLAGLKRLYPGYTPSDYAALAGKARDRFAEWSLANYTGARKAHDVKLINVPATPPRYVTRVTFQTMGHVKESNLEWTDSRDELAQGVESMKGPAL